MIEYSVEFPVRYYETDQMGVVHHSNYIRYFECARNAMMQAWNYPIEQCERDGFTIPVVSVSCRYRRSAHMGDTVKAVACIENEPLAKLTVKQAVYNQDGSLCAEGEVILGFLDKNTGMPVRCPAKVLSIIRSEMARSARDRRHLK